MQIRPGSPAAPCTLLRVHACHGSEAELLLLAQGAGSCWAVRGDFQLMWRLRRTGAMLFGRG